MNPLKILTGWYFLLSPSNSSINPFQHGVGPIGCWAYIGLAYSLGCSFWFLKQSGCYLQYWPPLPDNRALSQCSESQNELHVRSLVIHQVRFGSFASFRITNSEWRRWRQKAALTKVMTMDDVTLSQRNVIHDLVVIVPRNQHSGHFWFFSTPFSSPLNWHENHFKVPIGSPSPYSADDVAQRVAWNCWCDHRKHCRVLPISGSENGGHKYRSCLRLMDMMFTACLPQHSQKSDYNK
jgi:hypothetical protein